MEQVGFSSQSHLSSTEQLADSYYVNSRREGYFSSWAIRVIESNRALGHRDNAGKYLFLYKQLILVLRNHRLLRLQVQRLGKHFLQIKRPRLHSEHFFSKEDALSMLAYPWSPVEMLSPWAFGSISHWMQDIGFVYSSASKKHFNIPDQ